MKKIVLTLGILLSAYSTYAVNANTEMNLLEENGTEIVLEEDFYCTRIVRTYNEHGDVIGILVEDCD
ncbi:hypothetical protein [Aquimarina aggregata]|uniref:hypothetical protein n=1 Tax=Aquimarina aggregata TaxID=1642818 RepID=UPI0024909A8E|nr:hypothetical protein [Aquimarina aggregata]